MKLTGADAALAFTVLGFPILPAGNHVRVTQSDGVHRVGSVVSSSDTLLVLRTGAGVVALSDQSVRRIEVGRRGPGSARANAGTGVLIGGVLGLSSGLFIANPGSGGEEWSQGKRLRITGMAAALGVAVGATVGAVLGRLRSRERWVLVWAQP